MARPREFDEEKVLDAALNVFWEKGYEGTSVEDLVKATGLGRASLYGAFGDKEKLFERLINRYLDRSIDIPSYLAREGSAKAALEALLQDWISSTCPRRGPRGCFVQLASLLGESTPFAREAHRRSLARTARALAELITEGQRSGELPDRGDPADLARFLVVIAQGIASSARAGWGADSLSSVVKEAVAHVAG